MLTREQYFPGQSPEEQVALFIRRHWVAFLPWLLFSPVLFTIFTVVALIMWFSPPDILGFAPQTIRAFVAILGGTFYLSLMFSLLRSWMSFYLDVTIVTERRLVDIEQEGIFSRRIAEQSLLRVQDVSARQQGFLQHLLNYGNLYIETAGEQPNFELHNIPRPNDIAKTILDLHDRLVGAGGHEVEIGIAEGSYGPLRVGSEAGPAPLRHPLEELQPYFPEPGMTAAQPTKKSTLPAPKPGPGEGQLHEGETIKIKS